MAVCRKENKGQWCSGGVAKDAHPTKRTTCSNLQGVVQQDAFYHRGVPQVQIRSIAVFVDFFRNPPRRVVLGVSARLRGSRRKVRSSHREKLRDTLIDLHNYAGMAVMLLDENPDKI